LKELCLSALLRWLKQRPTDGLIAILESQLETLRAQMRSDATSATQAHTQASAGAPGTLHELVAALQKALAAAEEDDDDS
jgi:hypothetical protein